AGGAYVPLDPAHPSERLASILADAAPAGVGPEEPWIAVPAAHSACTTSLGRARVAVPPDTATAAPRPARDPQRTHPLYACGRLGRASRGLGHPRPGRLSPSCWP